MKQTQTHVWSLAGEEAVSYSLARGKAAAVTRESGEIAAYSLAPWREQSRSLALGPCLAWVPGLPRSVRVLIMRRRQTFENRGRPGLKYHVR